MRMDAYKPPNRFAGNGILKTFTLKRWCCKKDKRSTVPYLAAAKSNHTVITEHGE